MSKLTGCSLVAFLVVLQVHAATYYVDWLRPDDTGDGSGWSTAKRTIQAAVNIAVDGDSVVVTSGLYESISTSNKRITIRSVNGAGATIICGSYGQRCAALCVIPMVGTNTVLVGFTLTSGQLMSGQVSGDGGGSYGGTLINCTLTHNWADYGGGSCRSTLNNCTLSDNTARMCGGGSADCTLNNCTLTYNTAQYDGGGSSGGTLNNCTLTRNAAEYAGGGSYGGTLNNCTLTDNYAYKWGGGSADCTLNNCVLTGNSADSGGGSSDSVLNNCTLADNAAAGSGGGSYGGTLNNCALTGNFAHLDGGGSYQDWQNNCTVSGNSAAEAGGGVSGGTFANCVVWGNQAPVGENYSFFAAPCAFSHSCTFPLPAGDGNMSLDPLFVNPAKRNFRLSPHSPCIDAGDNWLAAGITDLAGMTRIIGGTVDMGAYESLPLDMALNNTDLVWSSGGHAFWFTQIAKTADGDGAAQSGPIADTQSVWIQGATAGKGTLQFDWKVSSEDRDYLRFSVDGQPAAAISGDTGWQTFMIAVTNAGPHAFVWTYAKGKSGAAGEDAGWLDRVVWSPVMATVTVTASPAEGGTVTGGGACVAGSSVELVATPAGGWHFVRWENDTTSSRRALTVPDDGCVCTAYFARDAIPLAEALDTTTVAWITDGEAAWDGWVLASAHDSSDAAQSGAIGDLGSSRLEATVTGSGTLSFWWRVSCEEGFDYLNFNLDGLTRGWLTGESGWHQVTLWLGPGRPHTLQWEYWKDESDAGGEDAAWLDQVRWTPDAPALGGFALWAAGLGLGGDPAMVFGQDRNSDGVPNGIEYAVGDHWAPGDAVLRIRMVAGRPVVETPSQDSGTAPYVDLAVRGCTNLACPSGAWLLPVFPSTDTTGKPADCDWWEPQGAPPKAFFRLEATLK